jgi:hypothetical protein
MTDQHFTLITQNIGRVTLKLGSTELNVKCVICPQYEKFAFYRLEDQKSIPFKGRPSFIYHIQTGSGAHFASCEVGIDDSVPALKR